MITFRVIRQTDVTPHSEKSSIDITSFDNNLNNYYTIMTIYYYLYI